MKHSNKTSTLIIQVNTNDSNVITYYSLGNPRERQYIIPRDNTFPFNLLKEGSWWVVRCEETRPSSWRWLTGFPLREEERVGE
jgi:hypothetical protein